MEQLLETFTLRINVTRHGDSPIDKLDSSIYSGQSLLSICDVVYVGNGIIFYFNKDGKLDLHLLLKKRYPDLKIIHLFFSLNALK